MDPVTLSGVVHNWKLNGNSRQYITVTLPYKQAKEIFRPNLYTADTGEGEQRQLFPSHVRGLSVDMQQDAYTPVPIAVGLTENVLQNIKMVGTEVVLTVNEHLPLIDGGHRFGAIEKLVEKGVVEALELPITAVVYLDTRNKQNFLNAQKGRPVDKAHMLSLQVGASLNDSKIGPYLKTAVEIAKALNTNEQSPFYKLIKFDSRSIAPLPISTLSAKGASDLGTSLIGSARLAQKMNKDATYMAQAIVDGFQTIKQKAPQLLEHGRVLTPPPNSSRGSATMWIGIGNLLAYRRSLAGEELDGVVNELVKATQKNCDELLGGNFSGPRKRELLGAVACDYFATVNSVPFYKDEIPEDLVNALSYSTFAMHKPVKAKKVVDPNKPKGKRGRKPKQKGVVLANAPAPAPTPKVELPTWTPPVVQEEAPDGAPAPWEQTNDSEEVQA